MLRCPAWPRALALSAALAATAAAQDAAEPPPAAEPAAPAAVAAPGEPRAEATCPYCLAPRGADEFCGHCGRLAGTAATAAGSGFWGDLPYLTQFPPVELSPTVAEEMSDAGLVRETVSFSSGDRYTWRVGAEGPVVEGRVGFGRAAKESRLHATIRDRVEDGRLVAREVLGEISGSPNSHLYRKLDYVYTADGLLDVVKFGTWIYADASDWRKKPGAWLRHSLGEFSAIRESGRLARVETTVREGRRSLRGEPEYAEPKVTLESVRRAANGAIDRLVAATR